MSILTEAQAKFFFACREAIAEKGEGYVYTRNEPTAEVPFGCAYVRDGEPSCLVAQGLIRSGLMSASDLSRHEGHAASMVVPWGHDFVSDTINEMQEAQDCGTSWGEAYDKAVESLAYEGFIVKDLLL